MKFVTSLALCTIVALIATSSALPAKKRMVYYQQPAQWYAAPQRMMYVQYVQPSRTHARSTQAASALVAGDSVATGTYLQDCEHAEASEAAVGPAVGPAVVPLADEEAVDAAGAHVAQSVAEAYPEEPEVALKNDDAAKVPRDYQFEAEEAETTNDEVPAPAPLAPLAPQTPAKRYLPAAGSKKVIVELEEGAETETADEEADSAVAVPQGAESDDDNDADAQNLAPQPNARRPAVRKPAKGSPAKPLPAGTFFPISFGGTSGATIAIANSFSTGEGGSATSHAIAYGAPDAARARANLSRRH